MKRKEENRSVIEPSCTFSKPNKMNMNNIERQLQLCLDKIEKWAMENGFKFSSSKTLGMHFCMDGLNRKRYIRNPIWIESTIYINLIKFNKILRALRLLFLSIRELYTHSIWWLFHLPPSKILNYLYLNEIF
jgi:hypothetical protein